MKKFIQFALSSFIIVVFGLVLTYLIATNLVISAIDTFAICIILLSLHIQKTLLSQ